MGTSIVLQNYINGGWCPSTAIDVLEVINPATVESLAKVPLSPAKDAEQAIQAAHQAFVNWRKTPASDRVQFLFKLKLLLEENLDDLAQTITMECGKTLAESKGEMRRAIENVEVACGIPILMQGRNSEDIARGIDELMIRQPLGVVGIICPFNFPGMIPFWFMPYAIAWAYTKLVQRIDRSCLCCCKGIVNRWPGTLARSSFCWDVAKGYLLVAMPKQAQTPGWGVIGRLLVWGDRIRISDIGGHDNAFLNILCISVLSSNSRAMNWR